MHLPGIIDFTLKVSDLLHPGTERLNETQIRQPFVERDANYVLKLKVNPLIQDAYVWGFSKHGSYTSRSGYKFLESVAEAHESQLPSLSPLEKNLWFNLWKTKISPKLKHFLWKALAGALAVSERLQSRGIQIDPFCPTCRLESESICHVLFHCTSAKEIWELSGLFMRPSGFSHTSVLLNLHHLLRCSKNQ